MLQPLGTRLVRTAAPALLLVLAGCAPSTPTLAPELTAAFDAGCETGRSEGNRERYRTPERTPVIDIERYADDEQYRLDWDNAFWQCFQRAMHISTQGARTRPVATVTYDEERARLRVDRYIRDALRAR